MPDTQKTYKEKQDRKKELRMKKRLKGMPQFCTRFDRYMDEEEGLSIETRVSYINDLHTLLSYILLHRVQFHTYDIQHLPISLFSDLSPSEIDGWMRKISGKKKNGKKEENVKEAAAFLPMNNAACRKRRLAAVKKFYQFLEHETIYYSNPLDQLGQRPANTVSDNIILDERMKKKFLDDVEKNELFLVRFKNSENGMEETYISDIEPEIKAKRERQVSRNLAILSLLLYTGLKTSEIAGLNIEDIEYEKERIRIRGAKGERYVKYTSEVRKRVVEYVRGPMIPEDLLARQTNPDKADFMAFCRTYLSDENAPAIAATRFRRNDAQFLRDVAECTRLLRRRGRAGFHPAASEHALFLSNRGTRMSVRMIEQMVKDMTLTYLPPSMPVLPMSPSLLRSACMATSLRSSSAAEQEVLRKEFGVSDQEIRKRKKKRD